MTALILLAHGSRHPDAARVLNNLTDRVRAALPVHRCSTPSRVQLAWLDLAEPTLDQACADLAQAGEVSAIAVPLLFTDAFHQRVDVPQQVADTSRHGVSVQVTDGLGLGPTTKRAILRRIVETQQDIVPSVGSDILLMAVGSSDDIANEAVEKCAEQLNNDVPGRVSAGFTVGSAAVTGSQRVIECADAAARRGRALIVVPLFTAPGVLWDRAKTQRPGVYYAEPLGELLLPTIVSRWDCARNYFLDAATMSSHSTTFLRSRPSASPEANSKASSACQLSHVR